MKMIKTDKLVFEYAKRDEEGNIIGKSRAIDEVSLDIEPGQFIAILGHNGSGKSTLAKHMNALLVPSDGTMWVDGMDTKEDEHLWDVRQSAGMVALLDMVTSISSRSVIVTIITAFLIAYCIPSK